MDGVLPRNSEEPLIGARYQLLAPLGQGGMGIVHAATDLASGRRVALKRLHAGGATSACAQFAQFEREFVLLSQLTHPRVVEAYDYGVERDGPYYTMELLDGGDLYQLAPLPWPRACALARDVCSALALLHVRRLVYRDLSPRNVRCTADGLAKLIDFGAMTSFGPAHEVVGTPPYLAPEALSSKPLDARTDLYALGATLYYVLTGRNAFPARSASQLWELWRTLPQPPSCFAPEVPAALDRLVMELIQLDPALRPKSAGEVMQRLSVMAQLPADEHLLAYRAYLAAPHFVGQRELRAEIRAATQRALQGTGASLAIYGVPGAGRSRVLDECALDAKIHGMLVVRVDGDGDEGDYALVRAAVNELLRVAPGLALAAAQLYLPVLVHVLPALLSHAPGTDCEVLREGQLHPRVQPALRAFLRGIAERRPLCIVVDDAARADDPSLALFAGLAQDSEHASLLLLSALDRDAVHDAEAEPAALRVFLRASKRLALAPLNLAEIETLLSSIFGSTPHLHQLSSYVEEVTAGNPRDIVRLLSHLANEQVIVYAAGDWFLPEQLSRTDLPSSMNQALSRRLSCVSSAARTLAYAFAAQPRQRFGLDECGLLGQGVADAPLLPTLRELLQAGVIVHASTGYRLSQLGFSALLDRELSSDARREMHRGLARVFAARGDELRSAQHWLHAGDDETGLAKLLSYASASLQHTLTNAAAFFAQLRGLPADWFATFQHAIALCEARDRPAFERDLLLTRFGGFIVHAVRDHDGFAFLEQHLNTLAREVGLDLFAVVPAELGESARRAQTLALARERYLALSPAERVREPLAAVGPLASALLVALGTIAFTGDVHAHARLPSLAPLVPLSPALWIAHETSRGLGARIAGRFEEAAERYEAMLARLNADDMAGLQHSEHRATHLRVLLSLGTMEACMGVSRCLTRAALVQTEPDYEVQALMVRHLYLLWQGRAEEAEALKSQLEQARAFSAVHHGFDGQHLLGELVAHGLADDLTRTTQATETALRHARVHSSWQPAALYGRGECQRMRGDLAAALREHRAALRAMEAAPHQLWANVAGAELRVLVELGCAEEARALGLRYLEQAEAQKLGYLTNYLRMPLSLALAHRSESARALKLAELSIDTFLALGSSGLNLAAAYETRARLAFMQHDREGFERYAALSDEQCGSANKRLRRAHARAESLHQAPEGRRAPAEEADDMETKRVPRSQLGEG